LGEEVVNHDGDDGGRLVDSGLHGWISGVGIHLVEPLDDDEDIHPAKQTVEDDQTSDDLEVEDYLLVEVESVHALHADTHSHVHNSDND
jgi:hypothetical protein